MDTRTTSRNQPQINNLAEVFVQGMARIVDIQTAAARVLLQTQGRSAAMFGAPDWTQAFNRQGEQFTQLFTTGAEQTLKIIRQTNETVSEVQEQVGHLLEQQTAQVTEQMRNGLEQVSRRSEQTLEEMRHATRQVAREAQRAGTNGNGLRHSRGRRG
jgi:gas vesicle protein